MASPLSNFGKNSSRLLQIRSKNRRLSFSLTIFLRVLVSFVGLRYHDLLEI